MVIFAYSLRSLLRSGYASTSTLKFIDSDIESCAKEPSNANLVYILRRMDFKGQSVRLLTMMVDMKTTVPRQASIKYIISVLASASLAGSGAVGSGPRIIALGFCDGKMDSMNCSICKIMS